MNLRIRNLLIAAGLTLAASTLYVQSYAGDEDLGERINPTFEIYAAEAADVCDPEIIQVRMHVTTIEGNGILTLKLYDDPDHFLFKKGG